MKNKIIITIITILALFLRLHKLGQLPNSYTPDELAQGYTAYSLLKTGTDEWGSQNYFSFRSFGDYKPPLQTWLMIPAIKLFGLTPLAARLPNALLSALAIPLIFLVVKKLFASPAVALLSALFLALSPAHLPMSRLALEANILPTLILLASFFLLSSSRPRNLILSGFFFALSLFCYHSAKVFIPLFLLLLIFHQKLKPKQILILTLPIVLTILFIFINNRQIAVNRTTDIAIFNPTDNWSAVSDSQYQAHQNGLAVFPARLFNNKLTYLYRLFSKNYFSYFSPQFLINSGAGETTYGMLPDIGILGLAPSIGLVYALFFILTQKSHRRSLVLLFSALLLAPIPAALAKGNYSANRASLMLPFLVILSAFGLQKLYQKFKPKYLVLPLLALFLFDSLYFLQLYFFQANQILADGLLFGRKQAVEYVNQHFPDQQIIFSTKLSEPQAYVAFFTPQSPQITQQYSPDWLRFQTEGRSFLDQLGRYQLDRFTFQTLDFVRDSQLKNTILVGQPQEFPPDINSHIIYYPFATNKKPAITIYQNETL